MEKELYLYLESATGKLCRVPQSKAVEFEERQKAIKNGTYKEPELTEEQEKRFKAMVDEIFPPRHLASNTVQEKQK